MKKLIVLAGMAIGLCALSVSSFAQNAGPKGGAPGGPGGPGKGQGQRRMGGMGMGKRMLEQLNLTKEQQAKIDKIREKMRDEMKANFKPGQGGAGADRTAGMEKMRAAMEKYQKDVMAVLTPEQQKKYKALMEEMKKKGFQGGPGGPGGRKGGPAGGGAPKKGGGGQ